MKPQSPIQSDRGRYLGGFVDWQSDWQVELRGSEYYHPLRALIPRLVAERRRRRPLVERWSVEVNRDRVPPPITKCTKRYNGGNIASRHLITDKVIELPILCFDRFHLFTNFETTPMNKPWELRHHIGKRQSGSGNTLKQLFQNLTCVHFRVLSTKRITIMTRCQISDHK